MRAGNLRRRVTIQAQSTTKDNFGQPIDTWNDVVRCWAQISAITAREMFALGSGFTSQVSHRITVRYPSAPSPSSGRSPIAAGMRVSYQARLFQVQAVSDPTEDKRELDLLCLESSK